MAAGFEPEHLDALGLLLGAVAEQEGLSPADAVARFLAAAQHHQALAGFQGQAAEAEQRARGAEADARQRDATAKVRKVAVDWAEWFVGRGITAATVEA